MLVFKAVCLLIIIILADIGLPLALRTVCHLDMIYGILLGLPVTGAGTWILLTLKE